MACCCKDCKSNKSSTICLGRCDLPKHRCLDREELKPGPVPRHMGWLYTAKDAPEHQLRCGWRPGHISCPVLRRIEQHNCLKNGECRSCSATCNRPPYAKPCCLPPKCLSVCPSTPSCYKQPVCTAQQPLIRITRHGGKYSICTKPSNMNAAPWGPFPLKYVLNTDEEDTNKEAKFSVEAKYNDYQFDYTSSQSSFVLDFTPPDSRCNRPCGRRSIIM